MIKSLLVNKFLVIITVAEVRKTAGEENTTHF